MDNRVLIPIHDRAPPPPVAGGEVFRLGGRTMGTTWSVHLVLPETARAAARGTIEAILAEQVAVFSHWNPVSELSRFNAAPAGFVAVSVELWAVVEVAVDLARRTGGAIDPTLGTLVDLWGFGPPGPRAPDLGLPDAGEIEAARGAAGWRRLAPDAAARRLFQPGGLRLDLSGIVKGHAVDRVSQALTAMGIAHHLVEIGGELRGHGIKPDGMPWWVDIESLTDPAGRRTLVALNDLALATSGDTQRGFEVSGRRYGHTIDGRSGWPTDNGLVSVSVLSETAMRADALATALTVLGPDEGLALAEAWGVAALFVTRTTGGLAEILSSAACAMLDESA